MDIVYDHVSKSFGKVQALSDFSLHIRDGEFMVMLGPSGCGKTTALRCLAGLERVTSGTLWIGDRIVNHLEPRHRDIALVFQSYALYPHMSVGDNIMYPLRIRGAPKAERFHQAREMADKLQIGHLFDRRPRHLSGGERQRVALARAIVRNPAAFLMDEPLSNLDAKLRVQMRADLKYLQRSLGVTTLYVTHDQAEAMTTADRMCVLNQGILQQVNTTDTVYNRPANLFVAGFVGSPAMNLVPVRYDPQVARFVCPPDLVLETRCLLTRFRLDEARPGEYIMGVQPEDVSVSLSPVPGGLAGTIYGVEPMGNEVIVAADVGLHRFTCRADPLFRAEIKTPCWLRLSDGALHLFDPASGARLPEKQAC
jgi:multiple sugar transport system ATP-binding protein